MTPNPPDPAPIRPRAAADDTPPHRYTAALADQIERRWQARWEKDGTYRTANPGEAGFDPTRPKFYCLDMFPYPSGAGLHVGHPEGYTATDIISRFKRMKGFNVLHPMGWDAFGLPAEQYALQTGIHPSITTRQAIDNFRRQLKRFGFSYDWSREFGTIDPGYYKWTQWIFLQIYGAWYDKELDRARPIAELIHELERGMLAVSLSGEVVPTGIAGGIAPITGEPVGVRMWHELTEEERRAFIDNQRLAYLDEVTVNWCPKLGTALANDEVTAEGLSERGHHPVFRKPLKQWMFRITAYAERLLADLEKIDWPHSTKAMQAEWIGKSEGAEIDFALDLKAFEPAFRRDVDPALRVFTTRPDTIFGATYMVVAPEHPLVDAVLRHPPAGADGASVRAYVEKARNMPEVERMENKEKTGVFSGVHAVNPATGEPVPVWIADYVLMGYGHGAIMAVPAHDERDFEFAKKFGLPITRVVRSADKAGEPGFAIELAEGELPMSDHDQIVAKYDYPECFSEGPWIREIAFRAQRDAQRFAQERLERSATLKPVKVVGFLPFTGAGVAANSANRAVALDGLPTAEAKKAIIAWAEAQNLGNRKINYKLHDWVFSRQRYWGEPFPIVYDERGNHYPVSEAALPVVLPPLDDYHPVESDDPQPLLAKANEWVSTTAGAAGVDPRVLPAAMRVRRETNTMPGSAGSSWYCIRYCDPRNDAVFAGPGPQRYWMGEGAVGSSAPVDSSLGSSALRAESGTGGHASARDTDTTEAPASARSGDLPGVDLYLGGSEHAVGHLLYARFWQKALFDLGHTSTDEPFRKLFHQGLITSFAYQRPDKSILAVDEVREVAEGQYIEIATGKPVMPVVTKMSKRYKNVVNPDDVIAEYGADTFRLYEMYMGPLEASKPWNPRDIVGLFRFLQKLWRLTVDEQTGGLRIGPAADPRLDKLLHRATAKVAQDIERLSFNTAIAALIEFVNAANTAVGASTPGATGLAREQIEQLALTLAPLAPHVAEELWAKLGHASSIALHAWPVVDAAKLVDDQIEIPVQVQGKVRGRITVAPDADVKTIEAAALADEKVQEFIAGKAVKKVIVVPGKMVNVVV